MYNIIIPIIPKQKVKVFNPCGCIYYFQTFFTFWMTLVFFKGRKSQLFAPSDKYPVASIAFVVPSNLMIIFRQCYSLVCLSRITDGTHGKRILSVCGKLSVKV